MEEGYWESKCDEWVDRYRRLERKYEELQEKYDKAYSDLDSAEFKIKHELEPRIQSEKRAYDRWVSSPRTGGDESEE